MTPLRPLPIGLYGPSGGLFLSSSGTFPANPFSFLEGFLRGCFWEGLSVSVVEGFLPFRSAANLEGDAVPD